MNNHGHKQSYKIDGENTICLQDNEIPKVNKISILMLYGGTD